MEKKVLVAYGTKFGATAEIADKIADVLNDAGLQAELMPAGKAGDISQYDAVVLGSAVYIGQWRKEVMAFLKSNESILAQKPVWLFSSGPTGEGDPVKLMSGWIIPDSLKTVIESIHPRDIAVFHGSIDISRLNFIQKFAIKNVKAPIGDFRDWKAITTWASSIAEELKK
jgi:menaquinone-dependent protoporphyrinogen oxidase